ncbi:MAG TPA: hypothetical protein DCL44_08745 [Elusimicrobia bacterium]|nr:hypothetical protein [Elusimicrobiota bacterium]
MKDEILSEPATKGDLINGLAKLDIKISALAETVTRLAIDGAKTQADVRQIKDDMATKMSTKDDISRILNAIDKFAGVSENYKRKDLERGHMLMEQHDKLENHEGRLILLETPK